MEGDAPPRPYTRLDVFKAVVFALLAGDTVYYAIAGTRSKALDAAAWLLLLALFEAETRFAAHLQTRWLQASVRAIRLAAALGIFGAAVGYVLENDTLDAVNTLLWIAVVVLLEIEVRYRLPVMRARVVFSAVAVLLYGALAALVLVWAARGEWLDAYDALLWLIAFATIELDLMGLNKIAAAPIKSC